MNFIYLKWIEQFNGFELGLLTGSITHVETKFCGRILQHSVQRPALVWMCTEGANTPSRSEPNPMDLCTVENGVTGQNLSLSSYL